jgi:hypothetical protein
MHADGFSLTRGGPFFEVLRRAYLVDRQENIRWLRLVLIVWLPIVAVSLVELVLGDQPDRLALDPSVHARLLVMLPLLIVGENLLETRCREAMRLVRAEKIADEESLNAILCRAERLRDARASEGVMVIIVALVGQAWLRGHWGGSGIAREAGHSLASIWCLAVALPLVQFLMLRWVWHWLLWTYVLARLSRLALSLNAIHPDRAAGLRILASPVDAFAVCVASFAALVAADWSAELRAHHATLEGIMPAFMTFVAIAIVIACAPLLVFSRQLYRAWHRDTGAYHRLAREYVDAFRRKWITERAGIGEVLGTSDIQSLNDLGGAFNTTVGTRCYPFTTRTIVTIVAGAALPMVPVVLMTTPVSKVAMHFAKILFGA